MSAIKIKVDGFEFEEQDLREITLSLPFGDFTFSVDFADGTTATRLLEISEIHANKHKFADIGEEKAITILNQVKNCVDYVYNVDICKDIYEHIDPMKSIKIKGKSTIFCLHLLNVVQTEINRILSAEKMENSKNAMREFVNKNA